MRMRAHPTHRLIAVHLDEASFGRGHPDVAHERATAIFDLLEECVFSLPSTPEGPYALNISLVDNRLVLAVSVGTITADPVMTFILSLTPLRRVVRDYHTICDSYYEAIRHASPPRIETMDMARRGIHNEGAEVLKARLEGKIMVDDNTARRLFTLIAVLYWKARS